MAIFEMCLAALKESSELTIQACYQPLTSEVTTKKCTHT
jgi:hypothetical protein